MLYLEIVNKQCILTSKGRLEPKSFDGCTEQEAVYNRSIERSERIFVRNEATIASLVLLRNYSYVRFTRWSLGPTYEKMCRKPDNTTSSNAAFHLHCFNLTWITLRKVEVVGKHNVCNLRTNQPFVIYNFSRCFSLCRRGIQRWP